MDPSVQFIEDITPFTENDLYRVRGVPGVAWAVRLYKGMSSAELSRGDFKHFSVIGLDDQTLDGAPSRDASWLPRRPSPARRDPFSTSAATSSFSRRTAPNRLDGPDERPSRADGRHLQEFAVVSDLSGRLYPVQPALFFAPHERRFMSFILSQREPDVSTEDGATASGAAAACWR